MKAAVVRGIRKLPVYMDLFEPVPSVGEKPHHGQGRAISHVVKSRAWKSLGLIRNMGQGFCIDLGGWIYV